MSTTYLLVPVRLDALRLKTPRTVVEAMADFSELPYHDGERDRNPNTPYLSEAVLADAFDDENLVLSAGVHLHWALPDALAVQGPDGFPAVPNRWLVTRTYRRADGADGAGEPVVDRWVVESDYLHPDGEGAAEGASTVPVDPDAASGKPRPFRYLGRAVPYALWTESAGGGTDEFATPLTAAGYGEPAFAAFYPNCASVFGFFDGEMAAEDVAALGLVYSVAGWYADPGADPVRAFVADPANALADPDTGLVDTAALRGALEEQFEWTFESTDGEAATAAVESLCFARLAFAADGDAQTVSGAGVAVAVGSTPTEALAAYLARRIVEADEQTASNPDGTYVQDDRDTLEAQLEALTLEDSVLQREVDTGAAFHRVRHEKEFTSLDAGSLWDVKAKTPSTSADASSAAADTALPADVVDALDRLNDAQARYDAARDEIDGRRRLLFADWCRYMVCAYPDSDYAEDYPDIDQVRRFILECGVAPLTRLQNETGTLEVGTEEDGGWVESVRAAEGDAAASLSAQAAAAADALLGAVDALNAANAALDPPGPAFGVRQVPAPRYWRPNDPVVLLAGSAAVRASERYGKDSDAVAGAYLRCERVVDADGAYADAAAVAASLAPDDLAAYAGSTGLATWSGQPWNPILLEWQVQFFPLRDGSAAANGNAGYDASCVDDGYRLAVGDADLASRTTDPEVMSASGVYEGTAILTDGAGTSLQSKVAAYCAAQVGAEYQAYLAAQGVEATVDEAYLASHENAAAAAAWYTAGHEASPADPVRTALLALEILTDPDFHSLSQALGGFADALVMHKQTMQLGVADPLGFDPFQEFAALVADAVGDEIERAPQPQLDFNPLRAGCMEPLALRLVDSFGQYLDLEWSRVTCARKLACSWDAAKVNLPPRLAVPGRLELRWISADGAVEQRTAAPRASPVCGWLLTNHLENSVVVYDAAGTMLGSVVPDATEGYWASAPGALVEIDDPTDPERGIANAALREVVREVLGRTTADPSYLTKLIGAMDTACESIEPESASQSQGLSLLVGRPLAVARVAVSLEMQGLPEYDQSWTQFRIDLATGERETHGYERIVFPVRVGEDAQLNDGLAGYWVEGADGIAGSPYCSLQSQPIDDDAFVTRDGAEADDERLNLPLCFDGAPTVLTLLLDPRGTLHATCGALPGRELALPPEHYAGALEKLEVTFLTAPILTGRNQVALPLADEPGYAWSWLSRAADGSWAEVGTQGVLPRPTLEAAFPPADYPALWADLVAAAWLTTMVEGEKAAIVARDLRTAAPGEPGAYDAAVLARVGDFLDRQVIGRVSTAPSFAERQVLREGWLKLTPQP